MQAFGISALVVSLGLFPIPFHGANLTFFPALLAAYSSGSGRIYGTVALIINLLHINLFSFLRMNAFNGWAMEQYHNMGIYAGLNLIQIVALIHLNLWHTRQVRKGVVPGKVWK